MTETLFHPDFKPEPYWWEAARPSTEGSEPPPEATEVLVVGAGYAGLATALELQRNGRSVWVAESGAFGEGASSRNGGAVSASVNLGKGISGTPGQHHDEAEVGRFISEGKDILDLLEGLIEREGIDCHYERSGRFVGTYAPHHFSDLVGKAADLNRLGDAGAEVLPPARQREEIGSNF